MSPCSHPCQDETWYGSVRETARLWNVFVVLILTLLVGNLNGQIPGGLITGHVRDADTLQGVPGTLVSIRFVNGVLRIEVKTDVAGNYHFLALPPGSYVLEFQKPGYLPLIVGPVHLCTGQTSMVSVTVQPNLSRSQETTKLDWRTVPENSWAAPFGSVSERWQIDQLPSARNIWALLENQEPSSVTNRVDEGGMNTGLIPVVGIRGGSWTQSGYRIEGINVSDPFNTGRPIVYPDLGSVQEFQVSTDSDFSEVLGAGSTFSLISRQGGSTLHGEAQGYYLGEPFQGSTQNGLFSNLGITNTLQFKHFGEGQFSLGGPVRGYDKWTFFTSLGFQHPSRIVPDFPEIFASTVYSGSLRLDGWLNPRDQLTVFATGQHISNSNLGARPGVTPSATLQGTDRFGVIQFHWNHRHSPETVSQIRFGISQASPAGTFQPDVQEPNRTQMFTEEMSGVAPLESSATRRRYSLIGQVQSWRSIAPLASTHVLHFGFDLEESTAAEDRHVFQDIQLLYYPIGVPAEVVQYNTPSLTKYRLQEYSFYFDDHIRIRSKLLLRLGVTVDTSSGSLPAQQTGAGTFAPLREFPGASGVIAWTTVEPRIGLVGSLREGTQLSAYYNRYHHLLPASYLVFANPNSLGGSVLVWNDKNQDNQYQPGEEGTLLRVFGGPYSSIDPALKRPLTDEWGLGVSQEVCHSFQTSLRLYHRKTKRLVESVNVGIPLSGYTPVQIFDAGDDNVSGTKDDQVLTAYNQSPSTLGQDHLLLTNPVGLSAQSEGLEASLRKQLVDHWFMQILFTAYKAIGTTNPGNSELENDPGVIGSLFDNPNTLLNAQGRIYTDRAYIGKISAYGRVPWGFYLGSEIKYFDGLPFGRRLIISGFNQGPFYVMATPRGEPGGLRTQYALTFDQRIARDFSIKSQSVSLYLDIFNLLNMSKSLREYDLSGPLFPLRVPLDIMNPRVLRFGLKWNF